MSQFPHSADFLTGPGEVRGLMRAHDWSASALGHPRDWQPELIFLVRLMLDSPFPAFIAWGEGLSFLYNDGYARILGSKHPAALGKPFAHVWSEIWSDIYPIVDKAMHGQSSYFEDLPLTVLRQDFPEQAWFTFSYSPIYLGDGTIGGMHCTVNESTDKVLAMKRQAFRIELGERLRTLTSPEAIKDAATALLGGYLGMDRVWYAEVNEESRGFVTQNMWTSRALPSLPASGKIDHFGPILFDTLRTGATYSVPHVAEDAYLGNHSEQYKALAIGSLLIVPLIKDGRLVTNLNLSTVNAHQWTEHEMELAGHVAEFSWAMIERARAEKAKWESELRYGTLIDIVDEGFAIVELMYDGAGQLDDYRFLEVNPAFESQSGMKDVIGKTIRQLAPHIEPYWIDLIERVAASGLSERIEHQAQSSGTWFSLYASRLDPADHRRIAILFNDITERKRNEEALRQSAAELAEVDRRKTEFIATLAHELRNPLAPLRTGLEVMRLSSASPDAIGQVRDMMARQITHMVRLIDDLLDIARISSGKVVLQREVTDLGLVIAHAVETCMPAFETHLHRLQVDVPDEPVIVDIDTVRIEQAISNLLANAAKYTPDRGQIAISLERIGQEAVIRVTDNGIGIPADALASVFDMFAQVEKSQDRSGGGLGIGLAIVHRLVAMHGGTVTAESAGPGSGSMFTIRLPVAPAHSGIVHKVEELAPAIVAADRRPLSILVADDNVDAAMLLAHLLRSEGHEVEIAYDGIEAVRIAQTQRPQVAILDIGMPGMTGYEVAREVRATADLQATTLVALTGWGAPEDRARTLEAGFDFHLTKPLEHSALAQILERCA